MEHGVIGTSPQDTNSFAKDILSLKDNKKIDLCVSLPCVEWTFRH